MKTDCKFEYRNTCTCRNYDIDTEETTESLECYGDCWEFVLSDFSEITKSLFDQNDTLWWKVSNFRLWDGNHNGFAYADTPEKLIEVMTVRGEWNINGTIMDDHIKYSLSHHDAPMGSNTTLSIITEEEREEWGLY